MESVVMATPTTGVRFKSRLRNILGRTANRTRGGSKPNRNHQHQQQARCSYSLRNNVGRAGNSISANLINSRNNNNNNNEDEDVAVNNAGSSAAVENLNNACKGPFTRYVLGFSQFSREVYNAISGRLGQTLNIPGDSVQVLFNDMRLYPSKQQVSEMLQCARQCSRRNGPPSLTFGEFCLFAREMQNNNRIKRQSQKKCRSNCEVFLGGSCNPTTWRTDTAIPELQKHGISYYNPQVSMWAPELVAEEHNAKQSASVLLYVVDSQTRSIAGMIEVAYLVASGRCVILVAYPYRTGQSIMGEIITKNELIDLIGGQTTLLALVKSQGIKVHNNLTTAIQCTTKLLRNPLSNGMSAEEQVTYKLRKLREIFDLYDHNRLGELSPEDVVKAYCKYANSSVQPYALYSYLKATNATERPGLRFSFEHFCALVAEFSSEDCENHTPTRTAWASQPLLRQNSRNNNYNNNNNANYNGTPDEINDNDGVTRAGRAGSAVAATDIFLGGSCRANATWRERAVEAIKRHGLTYNDPTVGETGCLDNDGDRSPSESAVLRWRHVTDKSRVLLFVVTDDTRSLTTMIMASYFIGLGRDVVLCVQQLDGDDSEIGNEKLSKQAIKDYNRGRVYLTDLAKRKHITVFDNITKAVQCAIEKCQRR